jgi:hypothetical protein
MAGPEKGAVLGFQPLILRRHRKRASNLVEHFDGQVAEVVTPLLPDVKIKNDYNRARFKLIDTDTSRELQNVMLREDYQSKARKEAQKHIARVREEGKGPLEAFLRRLLAGSFPGLTITVE